MNVFYYINILYDNSNSYLYTFCDNKNVLNKKGNNNILE